MEILIFIVIIVVVWLLSNTNNHVHSGSPNISTNTIVYPEKSTCECGKEVSVNMSNVDSSTWDLICTCGKIAYKHPKREERQQQLNDMMDW